MMGAAAFGGSWFSNKNSLFAVVSGLMSRLKNALLSKSAACAIQSDALIGLPAPRFGLVYV